MTRWLLIVILYWVLAIPLAIGIGLLFKGRRHG